MKDNLAMVEADAKPSYHDLYITTQTIPRTSIFNLPYNVEVRCTRVGGWEVWDTYPPVSQVAGEYASGGLRLDVSGHVIVDTLEEAAHE